MILYTPKEAARILSCKPKEIYYALAMGALLAWKVRWCWRIPETYLEEYAHTRITKDPDGQLRLDFAA